MASPQTGWIVFGALAALLLAADLFILNRRAHVLSIREATRWSAVVITTALSFGVLVWWLYGSTRGLEYFAGYLVELSLSVDNLFVFILIFQYFAVPAEAHSKVLNWGIFGAAIMRGIMVVAGTVVLGRFEWLFVVLGVVLLLTAAKMFRAEEERIEPEKNPLVKLVRRLIPMSGAYEDTKFFVRTHRGWLATPLLLVVIVVEWTDLVFAIDSIPAVFAISRDPFIVYTSNIFAILGLRALFFVLADALDKFAYLKKGVGIILGFVGVKMIFSQWYHLPILLSLGIILAVLIGSVALSIAKTRREAAA
ncbi:MAG: TerC/Alx family metal homeostasis membrane protein [Gemmatimonadetes bacterium]|nr:TerC/Alx family metal homeostasis membrane protein [Gemmatimonadota bacterium]